MWSLCHIWLFHQFHAWSGYLLSIQLVYLWRVDEGVPHHFLGNLLTEGMFLSVLDEWLFCVWDHNFWSILTPWILGFTKVDGGGSNESLGVFVIPITLCVLCFLGWFLELCKFNTFLSLGWIIHWSETSRVWLSNISNISGANVPFSMAHTGCNMWISIWQHTLWNRSITSTIQCLMILPNESLLAHTPKWYWIGITLTHSKWTHRVWCLYLCPSPCTPIHHINPHLLLWPGFWKCLDLRRTSLGLGSLMWNLSIPCFKRVFHKFG